MVRRWIPPLATVTAVALALVALILVPQADAAPAASPAEVTGATESAGATAQASPAEGSTADFDTIARLDELTSDHATVFRLYWAFFRRQPDPVGAWYWIGRRDACLGLDRIADFFAAGDEFRARYGPVADDEEFVDLLYGNILARAADPEGLAYWTGLLGRGELTRGAMVLYVSLSREFTVQHPYPSDGVPARSCHTPDGRATGRTVDIVDREPLVTVGGLTVATPAAVIERAGFHQSSHPGAQALTPVADPPIRLTTMASRNRGTDLRSAIDVVVEPATGITAPVTGTVARAGTYTLYCRYRDGYVVINPDGAPQLEVKLLHIQGVSVRAGQRVTAGDPVAAHATRFPFRSQVDALTAEPSWPHVHLEVVDPAVPRAPGGGC
ncbi:MAG: DUF4214 domain-containing protein [Acidimicrobiales bacterium]